MQEIFQELEQYIRTHGLDNIFIFSSGALGFATSMRRKDIKLSRKQKALGMFFGGMTAFYLTKLVVTVLNVYTALELQDDTSGAVGFFLGYIGMEGLTSLMVKLDNLKKKDK